MISVSFLLHMGILSVLFIGTGRTQSRNILITSIAPVRLVGSMTIHGGSKTQEKKSPPKTAPKPEESKPADESKGAPVISKPKRKSKKPKSFPPSTGFSIGIFPFLRSRRKERLGK